MNDVEIDAAIYLWGTPCIISLHVKDYCASGTNQNGNGPNLRKHAIDLKAISRVNW